MKLTVKASLVRSLSAAASRKIVMAIHNAVADGVHFASDDMIGGSTETDFSKDEATLEMVFESDGDREPEREITRDESNFGFPESDLKLLERIAIIHGISSSDFNTLKAYWHGCKLVNFVTSDLLVLLATFGIPVYEKLTKSEGVSIEGLGSLVCEGRLTLFSLEEVLEKWLIEAAMGTNSEKSNKSETDPGESVKPPIVCSILHVWNTDGPVKPKAKDSGEFLIDVPNQVLLVSDSSLVFWVTADKRSVDGIFVSDDMPEYEGQFFPWWYCPSDGYLYRWQGRNTDTNWAPVARQSEETVIKVDNLKRLKVEDLKPGPLPIIEDSKPGKEEPAPSTEEPKPKTREDILINKKSMEGVANKLYYGGPNKSLLVGCYRISGSGSLYLRENFSWKQLDIDYQFVEGDEIFDFDPNNGDYWHDRENNQLFQFQEATNEWYRIAEVSEA